MTRTPAHRTLRTRLFAASFALCLALGVFSPAARSGTPPVLRAFSFSGTSSLFQVGEELTYNVSYSSIDIGQVRIKLVEKVSVGGRASYRAMAYIDSYKGLPFVDLHAIYEDVFDSTVYSTWFRSRLKEDERWRSYVYRFDYGRRAMYIDESIWESGAVERRDTLRVDTLTQDGLSLFYLARSLVKDKQQVNIPVVVKEEKGTTFIDFMVEHTEEEIDAVDYPVDVVYFKGEAGFVGILGLTGGFEGWFSNDEARVPILA